MKDLYPLHLFSQNMTSFSFLTFYLELSSNQLSLISFLHVFFISLHHINSNLKLDFCVKLLYILYLDPIISFHSPHFSISNLHLHFAKNVVKLLHVFDFKSTFFFYFVYSFSFYLCYLSSFLRSLIL